MEQNLGAKNCVVQQLFSHEIVGTHEGALPREHVAGACFRSKLPRVYRPLRFDELTNLTEVFVEIMRKMQKLSSQLQGRLKNSLY